MLYIIQVYCKMYYKRSVNEAPDSCEQLMSNDAIKRVANRH